MKAAVAYIPVIHKGHKEFCQKVKPDVLYVLGQSLIDEFPILERDIRSLTPEEIVAQAKAIHLAPDIRILEKKDIERLAREAREIIFSNDDILRTLAERYFHGAKISFESTFLRWHKMNAVTKFPVSEDAVVSTDSLDREFLNAARNVSNKSSDWWRKIGAVVVKDGKVLFESSSEHKPSERSPYIDGDARGNFDAGQVPPDLYTSIHAEAGLIAKAAKQGVSLEEASLYVTTFPCPTCAMQIIAAGIKKVYYAEGYSVLNAERNFKLSGVKLIRIQED